MSCFPSLSSGAHSAKKCVQQMTSLAKLINNTDAHCLTYPTAPFCSFYRSCLTNKFCNHSYAVIFDGGLRDKVWDKIGVFLRVAVVRGEEARGEVLDTLEVLVDSFKDMRSQVRSPKRFRTQRRMLLQDGQCNIRSLTPF